MCDVNLITGRPKRRRSRGAWMSRPSTVLASADKLGKSRTCAGYRSEFVNIKGLGDPVHARYLHRHGANAVRAVIVSAMHGWPHVRERCAQLSGGERQHLAPACARSELAFDNGRIVEDDDHIAPLGIENGRYRRLFER